MPAKGDPFKKVTAGDKLQIPAMAYNAFIDATRAQQLGRRGGVNRQASASPKVIRQPPESGVVFVQLPNTGDAYDRFTVLQVTDVLCEPSDNLPVFKEVPVFVGSIPDSAVDAPLVITLEGGINTGYNDGIVFAVALGICAVQVDVSDAGHLYAGAKDGDETCLQSQETGPVRIVWKPAGTGPLWAIIMMPGFGGGLALSDEDPQDVGSAADPGVGLKASRDDHVHKGGGATTLVSACAEMQSVDANSSVIAVFSGMSDLELIDRDNSFDPATGTFLSSRPNGTQFRITLMTFVQPYSNNPVKAAVGLYKNGSIWVPFSIQRVKLPCASPLTYAQAQLCLNLVISLQLNDTLVVKLINEHASDPTTFNSTWLTIEEIP